MQIIYLFWFLTQMESILLLPAASAYKYGEDPPVTLPGCKEKCGEVLIPYPFGIGSNCFHSIDFEISCSTSFRFSKPFLRKLNIEVTNISWSRSPRDDLQRVTVRTVPQNVCVSSKGNNKIPPSIGSIDLVGSPFRFSTNYNVFMVGGCSGSVILKNRRGETLTGCASVCSSNNTDDWKMTKCNDFGVGCCFHGFSDRSGDLDFYQIAINDKATTYSQACHIVASLVYNDSVSTLFGKLSSLEPVSIVLDWHATDLRTNSLSTCYGASESLYCHCNDRNSPGNPYLPHGCLEYDGSDDATGECGERYCRHDHYYTTPCGGSYCHYVALAFRIGVGLLLVLCSGRWFFQYLKRKIELKQRAKYFKRNGGLLLQQQISSNDNVVEKARIFKVTELEKATDKFNKSRILGQGGQGTVYKGMMEDGKIVAVKKSKKVDESQLEQFINEVVILSQVNHRNVVKLIGCCLETEVPLLVYEFIPNGTLYHHIHDPSEDFRVTWKMRLQIAAESANAVAYLHSSSYPPIYHRDIKSTNILLDDKYRAKVSDFGTSKVINIDQTHVTTCVRGTYGYLDPEYFQSNQFTEKSDVYSFGVVLVELISGKKPIFPAETGGWISLASEFLVRMESYCLEDILDPRLLDEENKEEFMAVAKLARWCLKRNGKRRPTMKEVAMELEEIRARNVFNSAETSHREMSEVQVSDSGASMSFPDNNIANCFSIDVERLIAYSF